jgi:hypothetical protein
MFHTILPFYTNNLNLFCLSILDCFHHFHMHSTIIYTYSIFMSFLSIMVYKLFSNLNQTNTQIHCQLPSLNSTFLSSYIIVFYIHQKNKKYLPHVCHISKEKQHLSCTTHVFTNEVLAHTKKTTLLISKFCSIFFSHIFQMASYLLFLHMSSLHPPSEQYTFITNII